MTTLNDVATLERRQLIQLVANHESAEVKNFLCGGFLVPIPRPIVPQLSFEQRNACTRLQALTMFEIDYAYQLSRPIKEETFGMHELAIAATNVQARDNPVEVDSIRLPLNEEPTFTRVPSSQAVPEPQGGEDMDIEVEEITEVEVELAVETVSDSMSKIHTKDSSEQRRYNIILWVEFVKSQNPSLSAFRAVVAKKVADLEKLRQSPEQLNYSQQLVLRASEVTLAASKVVERANFESELVDSFGLALHKVILRKWNSAPSKAVLVPLLRSKMTTIVEFSSLFAQLSSAVASVPYNQDGGVSYFDRLCTAIESPKVKRKMDKMIAEIHRVNLSLKDLCAYFKMSHPYADLLNRPVFWSDRFNQDGGEAFPMELRTCYMEKWARVTSSEDVKSFVFMNTFIYAALPSTLMASDEIRWSSHNLLPVEIGEYLAVLMRSICEWRLTTHNDYTADPVSTSGRLVRKPTPPPPAEKAPDCCPVGFIYNNKREIEYVPPRAGTFYYIACPVRDDGTMRCRVTTGIPSARWKMHNYVVSRVDVDLVVGKKPREIRDSFVPPHDSRSWTVFRFFVRGRQVIPSFATVYNDRHVFGVVRMTELKISQVLQSDVMQVVQPRPGRFEIQVTMAMEGTKYCWHSHTSCVTPLGLINENAKVGREYAPQCEVIELN